MQEIKNKMGIMFNYYEMDLIYQGISDYYCMDCCKKRGQNPCEKCMIDKIQKKLVRGMNTLRQEYYDEQA